MLGRPTFFLLLSAGLVISLLSLLSGPVKIPAKEVVSILKFEKASLFHRNLNLPDTIDPQKRIIITHIRLPRYCLAALVGGSLALAGACLQGLFRNPLAEPSLIGVSSGASLGIVALLVLCHSWLSQFQHPWNELILFAGAFLCGLLATYSVYGIARTKSGTLSISLMLLTGVAITAFTSSLISCIIYFSHDVELRRFTYWSLGNLNAANWETLQLITPILLILLSILPFYFKSLNALALGEAEAHNLGIAVTKITRSIIFLTAAIVGVCVATCGIISFIGLIVPHVVRLAIGPNHKSLLPGSMLLGALTLIYSDWFARTILPEHNLPVGIITALLGVPFFMLLLLKNKQRFSHL